jgi:hypothetical protein
MSTQNSPRSEGETSNGTVIYLTTETTSYIYLEERQKRDLPEVIRIEDQPSLWRLPNEITTGTSLIELEKLNGKVFKMSGFDWDYGGNILSWNNGKLESLLKSKSGKVSATACLAPPKDKNSTDELSGDKEILSSNASMHKLNPVVVTISILHLINQITAQNLRCYNAVVSAAANCLLSILNQKLSFSISLFRLKPHFLYTSRYSMPSVKAKVYDLFNFAMLAAGFIQVEHSLCGVTVAQHQHFGPLPILSMRRNSNESVRD